MPPSIPEWLPAIEEDNVNDHHLLGSIEVIEQIENGKVQERIVFMPRDRPLMLKQQSLLVDDDDDGYDEEDYEDGDEYAEGIEISEETSLSNVLLDALLYGCAGCEPCTSTYNQLVPKSILKKPGDQQSYNYLNLGRNVSFSSVDIKEFDITLGDHPNARSGPPVCLDWESKQKETIVDLEEYEKTRSPRRKRKQLKISYKDRKGILEGQKGFSTEEVNQAWAEALRVRQQRQETLKRGLLMMAIDDAVESIQRKYQRAVETVGLNNLV